MPDAAPATPSFSLVHSRVLCILLLCFVFRVHSSTFLFALTLKDPETREAAMEVLSDMFLSDESAFPSPNAGRADYTPSNARTESHRPRDTFNVHKSNKGLGNSLERPNSPTHKATEFSTNGLVNTKPHQDHDPRSTPITISDDDPLNNNYSFDRSESPSEYQTFLLSTPSPEQEDLLEVWDYKLTRNTNNNSPASSETEPKHSDESSFREEHNSVMRSFSTSATDLQAVDRDDTLAHTPHVQERTYDSSSDSENSAYEEGDDAYDCISSGSSDLDFVRHDATRFWVLFGIRNTYSSPSCSERSFVDGDIETLPSEETDQDTENLSHSLVSDSSDLGLVRHDKIASRVPHSVRRTYSSSSSSADSFAEGDFATVAFSEGDQGSENLSHSPTSDSGDLEFARRSDTLFCVPHVVVRTYSSTSSSEDSFAEGEIATLATSDGDLSSHRSCPEVENFDGFRMDENAQPQDTYSPKYDHEDLGSLTFSDFKATRDCEGWSQMSRVGGRTYFSSEESLEQVGVNLTDSHHEVANQNTPHKQPLMDQPKYTEIQPQESQVLGYLAAEPNRMADTTPCDVQRNTSTSMEHQAGHDPMGRKQGATESVSITEKEHCATCEKLGEASAPHSRKWNLVKRAGRLLGKCFGRTSETSQRCDKHRIKRRRAVLRNFFTSGDSNSR